MSGLDLPGSVLDHAPIGVLALDAEQRVVAWNRRARHILGRSERAAMGARLDELLPPATAAQLGQLIARAGEEDVTSGSIVWECGAPACRKAVERHGGRIWVEPDPAGGTHVRFTLGESLPAEAPGSP